MLVRPRRSLDVLSISALDLFASALGVFVLLAIFLFPYYLRQPSLEQDLKAAQAEMSAAGAALNDARRTASEAAERKAEAEALRRKAVDELVRAEASESDADQAFLQAASRANQTAQRKGAVARELATLMIDDLDLVFVMDATGSMRDEIADVQRNLLGIVRILHRLAPTLNVGFVAFKDTDADYLSRSFQLTPMTGANLGRIQSFVEGLEAYGGEDYPEPVLQAIEKAVAMGWRSGVEARIVLIGDAPGHGRNQERLFRAIAGFHGSDRSRRVSAIFTGRRDQGRAFYRRVAEAGGGDFVAHRGRMIDSVLLSVLDSETARQRGGS